MNEEQKAIAEALISKIEAASPAGVHGTFVAELKELAATLNSAITEKTEE